MEAKVAITAQKVPLNGICVLDLTLAMAGLMCTQRPAEMSAGVITIKAPEWGDFSGHVPMAGATASHVGCDGVLAGLVARATTGERLRCP